MILAPVMECMKWTLKRSTELVDATLASVEEIVQQLTTCASLTSTSKCTSHPSSVLIIASAVYAPHWRRCVFVRCPTQCFHQQSCCVNCCRRPAAAASNLIVAVPQLLMSAQYSTWAVQAFSRCCRQIWFDLIAASLVPISRSELVSAIWPSRRQRTSPISLF